MVQTIKAILQVKWYDDLNRPRDLRKGELAFDEVTSSLIIGTGDDRKYLRVISRDNDLGPLDFKDNNNLTQEINSLRSAINTSTDYLMFDTIEDLNKFVSLNPGFKGMVGVVR